MIQLTKPVLIAIVAGIVAVGAIAVSAWRLSSVEGLPIPGLAAPEPAAAPPAAPAAPPASRAPAGPAAQTPAAERSAAQSSAAASGAAPAQGPAAGAPTFDVVRVDPRGDAVVAGRAPPRSKVALTIAGKPVAEAEADADGQFVILPPALPPGDHMLALRATSPSGEVVSEQSVAIAVPQRGERETIAALSEPNKPTVVLSQSAAPPGSGDFRIVSVEAQQGGALFASGVAPAGSSIRLYLNEAFVAPVEAGPDGKWSVKVERGMAPGAYRVRADRVGADGRPLARVEAPFDYPAMMASARPAAPDAARAAPGEAAREEATAKGGGPNAVVPEVRTARVERGDSLWRISRSIYGEGLRYTQIYDANTSQIRDPDLIFPGQILVVPKEEPRPPATPERRR